jgi:hypothetical protein
MAFYIKIMKLFEDGNSATFSFGDGADTSGTFRFDKAAGDATLLTPMPGDENGHRFGRAAVKIIRAAKLGDLPEVTEWAS